MTKIPRLLAVGLLAAPLAASAGDAHDSKDVALNSTAPSATSAASIRKASPEVLARVQAMRDALSARTAFYDRTEQAFRAPTAEEQQALAGDARVAGSAVERKLANGGVALGAEAAELSFLVVEVQPDGTTVMRHADAAPQPQASAEAPAQSAREVRHAE